MRTNDRDELLQFYRDELSYLRGMGSEFAAAHKKLAGRLELSENEVADPHVERLIQSFAFLTARLQLRLHEEFPEITTALLDTLYPQLINPIPAMSIARFEPDPAQGKNTTGELIPALSPLFHNTPENLTCRFRTCYPITLWPLEIAYAAIEDTSEVSFISTEDNVAAVVHLKLRCPKGALKELQLDSLRFFLDEDPILVNALYEILFTNVAKVAVLPGGGKRPYYLRANAIRPVGFGLDEQVLPYPSNAHPAYRLLQEYFSFPEKYHFFDLDLDLHRNLLILLESNLESLEAVEMLEIFLLLGERPASNLFVNTDTFKLGCTPVINLFPKTTEPIRVDQRSLEYQLIADKRREGTTEIHSIQSVSASSDPNEPTQYFEPFYSYNHFLDATRHRAFWHAIRRNSTRLSVPGTEMYISFLDLNFEPVNPPAQTVYAHTLCTNRELATRLPKNVQLHHENKMPTHTISLIGKRSLPLSPLLGGSTVWRLISHLSLNHLSLSEGGDSLNALREILGLYCVANRPSTHDQINGITEMEIEKKSIYLKGQDAWRGFRRGTQITLTFDEAKYRGSSAFLLGAVLNRFFALYTSVNTFTQLKIKKRTQPDTIWKEWEPRAGEKIIL